MLADLLAQLWDQFWHTTSDSEEEYLAAEIIRLLRLSRSGRLPARLPQALKEAA